ncbi:MAG: adenylyl-sulfate kinase [Bacteroidota bacterium]|nr:adenylyl-sulfate kinase [Bacteroidota bacterium]
MVKTKATNIHPLFDRILLRTDKEKFLKQKAKVVWLTGLSGSGKSTIAIGLERKLHSKGFLTQILDGDNVRTGINKNLGFSDEDRTENIRRIAEVSKLFLNCGIITINSFVSPTIAIREQAREIIGKDDFIEVYINVPIEVAEKRDVKGLYKKARAGEIKNFTGIDAPFEEPPNPAIELKTHELSIDDSVEKLYNEIIKLISSSAF